jgi:hypothetical protein
MSRAILLDDGPCRPYAQVTHNLRLLWIAGFSVNMSSGVNKDFRIRRWYVLTDYKIKDFREACYYLGNGPAFDWKGTSYMDMCAT